MENEKKPSHDCYCKSGTAVFRSGCNKNDRIIQDAFEATWQRVGSGGGGGGRARGEQSTCRVSAANNPRR